MPKNSGGTCRSDTTTLAATVLNAHARQMTTKSEKSRRDIR
jgi:hypothetical protein